MATAAKKTAANPAPARPRAPVKAAAQPAAGRAAVEAPNGSVIVRDDKGHQIRLGDMQQIIVDYVNLKARTLDEVAERIREPAEKARTRLRKLAARGVVVFEGEFWRMGEGPAVPSVPPPHASRARSTARR